MCECLDYDDGTRHTCEACVGDLELLREELAKAESRLAKLEAALRAFVDPESYSTSEEACRENKAMGWCAVHSFRWPCPVEAARAALAAQGGEK